MSRRFPFEAGFFDSLELMPLCIRRSLDLARVKLPLRAWQALPLEDRVSLRDVAVETPADAEAFRTRVRALATGAGVEAPDTSSGDLPWRKPSVPARLREALAAIGRALGDQRWAALDDQDRFALVHLAGKGHEDGRLEEACATIGLAQREAA